MSPAPTDLLLPSIAIRAARLLLDSQAELISDGAVLVRDGLIISVGRWPFIESQLLPTDTLRDLGDSTLCPGLFDVHVHLQMDPGSGTISTVISKTDDELLPLMISNAAKLLDAGVTTASDLGGRGTTSTTLRDRILAREVPGPRLHVANAPITVRGGHAHAMGGEAEGVEGVRAEVRKRVKEGVNVIKAMASGGFMTPNSHPAKPSYSQAELTAMAEESHKFNIPITTHATGTESIRRVVEAGFDSIEHCAWLTDHGAHYDAQIAAEIVRKGIAVVPTMNSACLKECYFCPWDTRSTILSNLSQLREAGAKMVVGTDAGIGLCHFERYADGLLVLLDAGYTPREIIASATDVAADVCGITDITGKLHPGLEADVVAFEGNPLEDIAAFSHPVFVMARGREHVLRAIRPFGDQSAVIAKNLAALKKGAGMAA